MTAPENSAPTPDDHAIAPPGERVDLGGQIVHVVTEGAGPPILLLTALGSNWFDLDALAARLRGRWQVIRYDRPGYGFSAPLPRDAVPTLAAEVGRMAAVLDHLGVDRPVVIGAHSISSLYAEGFARNHPERVAGVAMIDGTYVLLPWRILPTRWRVANCYRALWVIEALRLTALGGVRSRDIFLPRPPGGYTERQSAWIDGFFARPATLLATLIENAGFPAMNQQLEDLRKRSPMPPVPTVVLAAVPQRGPVRTVWGWKQRRFARRLGAIFTELRPAGHFVVLESPATVADALNRLGERAGIR
ncbi:alpha/beta fold hydrolase [Williamsia sterculiae]|uniref:Pimeloyl-ACP methyl ester carboxylesterase n=1 Tax=Williamsia sterculiae TaxID=1344003 RepID=A0A1N7H9G2_9NOCA|nr:alpha/beta hydrolase [Williamsia sterculiae]SIS21507.1 Pimeloyl-ACP methyl ester carboxylesterase [Williamsia sterculiae]